MKRYFCTFVNYQQDDWSKKLLIAKFAVHNYKLTSIKLFLFFTIKGLYLYISFDIIDFSNTSIHKRIFKQKALNISRNIETA